MRKYRKGEVAIYTRNNNLELIWRFGGQRYYMALGLPDSVQNRSLAEKLKLSIELDIVNGVFDSTLEKYRPPHQQPKPKPQSIEELLKTFPKQQGHYLAAFKKLKQYFGERIRSKNLSNVQTKDFVQWLRSQVKDSTAKRYLVHINAVWAWGVKEGLVMSNPWTGLTKGFKEFNPKPEPFNHEEVSKILEAVKGSHYGDFIEFLLKIGVRIGEAIALQWEDVSADCSWLWIKPGKTGGRKVTVPPSIKSLLLKRKAQASCSLVFTNCRGGMIRRNSFRFHFWKPLLKRLEIPYRKPHNCRATLITHQLEAGTSPVNLAKITGHSPQTMYRHYFGSTSQATQLKEIY